MPENIKTEFSDYNEDSKMDTDFYSMAEPQVDIIQTCDAQTQTTSTSEQQIMQKLQTLEKTIKNLREDWRRDRETQNALMEQRFKKTFENHKVLIEEVLKKMKSK